MSAEQILAHTTEYITNNAVDGWAKLGSTITGLKTNPALRWVNPLEIKNAVESAFNQSFGAKEAAKPKPKVKRLSPNLKNA